MSTPPAPVPITGDEGGGGGGGPVAVAFPTTSGWRAPPGVGIGAMVRACMVTSDCVVTGQEMADVIDVLAARRATAAAAHGNHGGSSKAHHHHHHHQHHQQDQQHHQSSSPIPSAPDVLRGLRHARTLGVVSDRDLHCAFPAPRLMAVVNGVRIPTAAYAGCAALLARAAEVWEAEGPLADDAGAALPPGVEAYGERSNERVLTEHGFRLLEALFEAQAGIEMYGEESSGEAVRSIGMRAGGPSVEIRIVRAPRSGEPGGTPTRSPLAPQHLARQQLQQLQEQQLQQQQQPFPPGRSPSPDPRSPGQRDEMTRVDGGGSGTRAATSGAGALDTSGFVNVAAALDSAFGDVDALFGNER
jgi:hypothetical protein